MRSVILTTAAVYLMPVLLLFSVFLLVRGHNEPGGGFSGGLVAATAVVLLSIAGGVALARRVLGVDPRTLIGLGLLVMVLSGLVAPILEGRAYLAAVWWSVPLPGGESLTLGTPLLFDVGVYLAVAGTALFIVLGHEEEAEA